MLHSDPELLEVDVDIEKFQNVVLWKMEYFHAAEMVVERDYTGPGWGTASSPWVLEGGWRLVGS